MKAGEAQITSATLTNNCDDSMMSDVEYLMCGKEVRARIDKIRLKKMHHLTPKPAGHAPAV